MNELKTGYEWCLSGNMRILDIMSWDTDMVSYEESYHTEKITSIEFLRRIGLCKVKANSTPRKSDMYLEYRMYGLVAYQLSGTIHAGIQFGHAVVEYQQNVRNLTPHEAIYNKWAKSDKTFIILNGGTTNNNPDKLGSLNQHLLSLNSNGIITSEFNEPDLGDQLTAFVFLVDERVFNRELYPDFQEEKLPYNPRRKPTKKEEIQIDERNDSNYQKWVEKIGGPKNAILREFLKPLRLA
jgi:hypothetical protein